jgi:hypothetical protein
MEYGEAVEKYGSSARNRLANQRPDGSGDTKGHGFVLGLIVGIMIGSVVLWISASDHFKDSRDRTDREIEELKSAHADKVNELETTIQYLDAELIDFRVRCVAYDAESKGK